MQTSAIVETKIGKFLFTLTDENHVYVCNKDDREYPPTKHPIKINGKEISYVATHFNRRPDGIFDMNRDERNERRWAGGKAELDRYVIVSTMTLTRDGIPGTNHQQIKAYEVISEALNAWIKANPEIVEQAAKARQEHEIACIEEALSNARGEVVRLEKKLAEIKGRDISI